MITIKNLKKSFGKLQVLNSVNLEIPPGKITAVLGPNGSGKTTLIKSVLGMVIPDSGTISVDSQPVLGNWEYRSMISYIPQISNFPENLTINELIKLIERIRGQKGDPSFLIEMFELETFLKKRIKHLSGGTRQKANITLACMFNNRLIIMDEPTSGLDPVSMLRLKKFICQKREEQKTVLFTTHIMPLVEELADEIVFLLEGNIYYHGPVNTLMKMYQANNLEEAIAKVLKKDSDSSKKNGRHVKNLAIQYI